MRFYIDEPRLGSGAAQPEITIGLNTTDTQYVDHFPPDEAGLCVGIDCWGTLMPGAAKFVCNRCRKSFYLCNDCHISDRYRHTACDLPKAPNSAGTRTRYALQRTSHADDQPTQWRCPISSCTFVHSNAEHIPYHVERNHPSARIVSYAIEPTSTLPFSPLSPTFPVFLTSPLAQGFGLSTIGSMGPAPSNNYPTDDVYRCPWTLCKFVAPTTLEGLQTVVRHTHLHDPRFGRWCSGCAVSRPILEAQRHLCTKILLPRPGIGGRVRIPQAAAIAGGTWSQNHP